MTLKLVPLEPEPEHGPVCSVDGEPWPCLHHRRQIHEAARRRYDVFCLACGKRRNGLSSLTIEAGFDGRPVYFHARKRCYPKAKEWWDENVRPLTGEEFGDYGHYIQDLMRYVGGRTRPQVVPE